MLGDLVEDKLAGCLLGRGGILLFLVRRGKLDVLNNHSLLRILELNSFIYF